MQQLLAIPPTSMNRLSHPQALAQFCCFYDLSEFHSGFLYVSLDDLIMYFIDLSNSAMHEANTACVLQSQPVTPNSTDAQWELCILSCLSMLVYLLPCSRCVAPISTVALSQSRSEPHCAMAKAPWHSLLCSPDWAAHPVVPHATPGDCVQALVVSYSHGRELTYWGLKAAMHSGIFIPVFYS